MKTILPWLLVVVTAGGAMFFYNGNQTKSAEVARLQAQVQEVEALRTEIEELKKNQVPAEELARLKESKEELPRLRNQVRQLTADKAQLGQQAQAAQAAAAQAQVQAQAQVEAQNLVLAKAREEVAATTVQRCQNQLRQLQAAKQQWAVEHQKASEATPNDKDIAPYLPGELIPSCPGGGKYILGPVASLPACSLPGHVLPPPTQ